MATPAWIGATSGQPPLAAQVNAFLGTHAITYAYTGVRQGGQTTLGSGTAVSNGQYNAQQFVPGSSFSLGRVQLWLSVAGSPGPMTVSVQGSSGSAPSGTVLASAALPAGFVSGTAAAISIPLSCALVSGTTYWIVLSAAGDASNYYSWWKSNQVSGASTSSSGTSWTAQAYGLYYSYWDQSAVPPLAHTVEDAGARWTTLAVNSSNQPTSLQEYTVAQGSGQYVSSSRSMSYSGGSLIGVA